MLCLTAAAILCHGRYGGNAKHLLLGELDTDTLVRRNKAITKQQW